MILVTCTCENGHDYLTGAEAVSTCPTCGCATLRIMLDIDLDQIQEHLDP